MFKSNQSFGLLLAFAALLVLTSAGFTAGTRKIPITTSSKEALQLFLQGRDKAETLQAQESKQYFEHAAQQDPNFAMAYLYLSAAQPNAKSLFESLDKAVALVDKVSEGERLWILGTEAGIKVNPKKQKECYQKLVELYPDDERAHNLLGLYYFGQQQWGKSVEEFDKAVTIAPNFSQPYNQLGYAYRFLGKLDEAEKAFKMYIELIPKDPNPYDSYAELLMKMGRFDESIASYQKALEQNPNFVASYTGMAVDYTLKGEPAKALEQLQKLYGICRNDGERRNTLFNKAICYVDQGNYEQALAMVDQQYLLAKKIDDAAAMAGDLTTMGTILTEMGKADEALAKFDAALQTIQASALAAEVKENNKRFYLYNSATAALAKGDFKTAQAKSDEFAKAAAANYGPVQISLSHQLAGMIALGEKNYSKAVEELQQSSTDFNPYNFYRLALAYQGAGDKAKAKELFNKAAYFNGLDGMTYAFCRTKALNMLKTL